MSIKLTPVRALLAAVILLGSGLADRALQASPLTRRQGCELILRQVEGAADAVYLLEERDTVTHRPSRHSPFANPNYLPNLDYPGRIEIAEAVDNLTTLGISTRARDEVIILDEVAVTVRRLFSSSKETFTGHNYQGLRPDELWPATQFAAGAVELDLDSLKKWVPGLEVLHEQNEGHPYSVVRFPSGRAYLIDLTWAQFDGTTDAAAAKVGVALRQSGDRGVLMANILNLHGFIPFDGVAKRLLSEAFHGAHQEAVPPSPSQAANHVAQIFSEKGARLLSDIAKSPKLLIALQQVSYLSRDESPVKPVRNFIRLLKTAKMTASEKAKMWESFATRLDQRLEDFGSENSWEQMDRIFMSAMPARS